MKAVDLFCGVGGLSKGISSAGFNVVSAYDNWEVAIDTYNNNLNDHGKTMNLLDVDNAICEIAQRRPEIIVGGPPCQDFSTAGHRIEGSHANLTVAYARIVTGVHPWFALMENVPQARNSSAYRNAKRILRDSGYHIWERVLNASLCNVPQIRKRFFMFAYRNNSKMNVAIDSWIDENQSKHPLTIKEYMKNEIDVDYYYRHPRNYSRRAVFTVYEPSPTIRGVNRPVPPNYKRNHLDSACPTQVRPLTSLERSRIQTFPPEWKWSNDYESRAKTDIELLIGNAVPVNLAEFIGRGILHATQ